MTPAGPPPTPPQRWGSETLRVFKTRRVWGQQRLVQPPNPFVPFALFIVGVVGFIVGHKHRATPFVVMSTYCKLELIVERASLDPSGNDLDFSI